MKKNALFGLLAIALAFGFIACGGDGEGGAVYKDPSQLSGTSWVYQDDEDIQISFLNKVQFETKGLTSGILYSNGTYSVSGNTITFTTANVWNGSATVPNVMVMTGTVDGNQMTLRNTPGGDGDIVCTKEGSEAPGESYSVEVVPADGCVIKVFDKEYEINMNDYNSVSGMASIENAVSGRRVYVAIIPTSDTQRIKLFPLTISGVSADAIRYHDRFSNTYGPIEGAVYRITMPAQNISISAEAAIDPVTVSGTVNMTLAPGTALGPDEHKGLSIDFEVAEIPNSSIAGTHVDNVLGAAGPVSWSVECIPDQTYTIQGRVRMDNGTDDGELIMKPLGTITVNGNRTVSGSTDFSVIFP